MNRVSSLITGIAIVGENEFINATNEALLLLRDLPTFHEVKPYLAVIKQAPTSEINVFTSQPTFSVGKPTWSSGAIWYASTIIHDACHSKLYHQNRRRILWFAYTPLHYWTGKEAEKTCLRMQFRALREMECDTTYYQHYTLKHLKNPTHHKIPYDKRDW